MKKLIAFISACTLAVTAGAQDLVINHLSETHTMIQVNDLEGIVFNEAMLMAATFLCIIPIMIAYLILQRRFMEGVERSGLTGM